MAVDRAHGNQASRKQKFNPGTVFFLYLAGNDVTLLHCVSFTPFSVVAVRLNDIHIFWIAIGSGSRLRRNGPHFHYDFGDPSMNLGTPSISPYSQ